MAKKWNNIEAAINYKLQQEMKITHLKQKKKQHGNNPNNTHGVLYKQHTSTK
jgi:hypothetical protein